MTGSAANGRRSYAPSLATKHVNRRCEPLSMARITAVAAEASAYGPGGQRARRRASIRSVCGGASSARERRSRKRRVGPGDDPTLEGCRQWRSKDRWPTRRAPSPSARRRSTARQAGADPTSRADGTPSSRACSSVPSCVGAGGDDDRARRALERPAKQDECGVALNARRPPCSSARTTTRRARLGRLRRPRDRV